MYSPIDELVCNVFPQQTGVVLSGRVTGPHGWAVSAMDVSCGGNSLHTDYDGRYHFILPPGTYQVSATNAWRKTVTAGPQSVTLPTMTRTVNGNRILDLQAPNAPTVQPIVRTRPGAKAKKTGTTFSAPFEVTLSCATEGSEIHYTLDGSEPGGDDPVYEGPIAIQDTTTLRAVAMAPGMERSEMLEETYTFKDPQSRDNFADARPISGASGKSAFSNAGCTRETGEPQHGELAGDGFGVCWQEGGASVWASWTAPADGEWTFWLSGTSTDGRSPLDTFLAIYTGDAVEKLVRVVPSSVNTPSDEGASRLSFHAVAGTEYKIAMDTPDGDAGILTLRWEEGYVHWVQPASEMLFVPRSGGHGEIAIASSTNWRVVEYSALVDPETMGGVHKSVFSFTMPANGTGRLRTETVTFQAGNSALETLALLQHPSLDFATAREEALDWAWRDNKRILLVKGRETCSNTREMLYSTLPSSTVKPLLDAGFVVWFSNCDRQSDAYDYTVGESYELPVVCAIDPRDISHYLTRTMGPESGSTIRSLLSSLPDWPGMPLVKFEVQQPSAVSATVTTKVREWGSGASSATVTLERGADAAFTDVESTRTLGTVTELWTAQAWTFGPPSATEAAFYRVRVTSGDWSVVSDVVEFIPLSVALDNDGLSFTTDEEVPWMGQTAESHDGVDAVLCANPPMDYARRWASSMLKTTVRGPGRLSFWWKSEGSVHGGIRFNVDDGSGIYDIRGTNESWEARSHSFANTNSHEVAWEMWRYDLVDVTGVVDQVTWTPGHLIVFDSYRYSSYRTVVGIPGEPLPEVPSWALPERTGYTFGGYYSGTNGTGTRYYTASGTSARTWNRSGNTTLYAKWTPKTYTATLDRAGGTGGTASVKATYGKYPPTVDIPDRPGYDFVGYYAGENGAGEQYYNAIGVGTRAWYVASNATLHAHWMEKAEVKWGYRIENGKAIVTNAAPARGKLSMPATLGGCPVEGIGVGAFYNETNLLGMAVSGNVKNIGECAFYDCWNLASVTLPGSVTNIGRCAFEDCGGLTSVEIPAGVKRIGDQAFYSCDGLTSLTLGDGVEDIGNYAFYGCTRLASVTIPVLATNIGLGAFGFCPSLTQFQVADGNTHFASENGVLFSEDKTTLVCCPGGRAGAYEVPSSVTAIGEEAFYFCSRLASAVIPDSVTNLGNNAFWRCDGLKRLEVPGAWWGTDKVAQAQVPEGCEVVYRGIQPLAVTTASLPEGLEGGAYEASLSATGGAGDYTETGAEGSHAATGTARGWKAVDACWDFALPFAFPFFGHSYTNAKINSNGAISFGTESFTAYVYSEALFKASPIIAVLWNDLTTMGGDIYTETGSDWAKVRWKGTYYAGGEVNCSATLRKNGTIVLSYGAGNEYGGAIGISAGDGESWTLSGKSGSGSMANAEDIVFRPGDGMPEWLELTADGVLRGTPAADGEYAFAVTATDAAGVAASRELVLTVQPLVSQRVTFDANGGTCATATRDYAVGEPYGSLPSATRKNHALVGWFTAPEGGTQITADTTVPAVAARTLWAHWKAPNLAACRPQGWPAEIYLATEAGSTAATTNVWTGETAYLNFAYTNAGNAVAGTHRVAGAVKDANGKSVTNWSWSLSRLGTNAYRCMTNIALSVASAGTYEVTVALDSGGAIAESDESDNELRWSFTATAPQKVTFDANGGTCATTNRVYPIGKTYGDLPDATKKGYSCQGWFTAATGGTQVTAGSQVSEEEERTLWAHWKANAYQITLDMQDGNGGAANVTATYGKAMPAITVPARTGYAFGGYYTATDGGGTRYYTETGTSARTWNKTAATTLYAKWTANIYEVTLDPQGGTGGTESVTATFGAAMPGIEVPKKAGHEFIGYFSERNGTGTRYYSASGESCRTWDGAGEATLYAHWVEPKTVWRFYSDDTRGHFFTISESEKDKLVATSKTWQFEGGAYRAYTSPVAGTVPLYRFWSDQIRGHFFTVSESEKNHLIATSKTWQYEGIAYHVYPKEVSGSVAVYRFWSDAVQHHFYTVSAAERDSLRKGKTWSYEGIAFWALPREESAGPEEPEEPEEPEAELQTVWRFYSDATRGHFFTISAAEKEKLRTTSKTWQFEGAAYRAFTGAAEGTVPLYRFWSDQIQGHFFTISESEKNHLIATSKTWQYEGIAYHVYPKEVAGSVAVYRFWSDAVQHHFYTVSASERDSLRKGKVWNYEGIAFWALPQAQTRGASKAGNSEKRAQSKATAEPRESGLSIDSGENPAADAGVRRALVRSGVAVTTSDGSDGSAVADGDDGTGWAPEGEGLGWAILSLPEPLEVASVEVSGENLPEELRVLLSEDAEEWFERESGVARYVWVAWEGEGVVVREIWVESVD